MGFPAGKESTCNVGDLGSIPGLGTSPGEGKGYRSSILAWKIPWPIVHGVAKSRIRLSDFHRHTDLHYGSFLVLDSSMGFYKCILLCLHHYGIMYSGFTALKILHASPIQSSLPFPNLRPGNHQSFYSLHSCANSRMSCVGIMCYIHSLSFNNMNLRLFHLFCDCTAHLFLVLNNIIYHQFIHSPEGHLGSFQVFTISKVTIKIYVQVFVWKFSAHLSKYQGAQLLDHVVRRW